MRSGDVRSGWRGLSAGDVDEAPRDRRIEAVSLIEYVSHQRREVVSGRQPGTRGRRKAIHDLVVTDIGVGNDRVVNALTFAGQKQLLTAAITRPDASTAPSDRFEVGRDEVK